MLPDSVFTIIPDCLHGIEPWRYFSGMNPEAVFFTIDGAESAGLSSNPSGVLHFKVTAFMQAETVADWLRQEHAASFVDFYCHTIYGGTYHNHHNHWQATRAVR